MTQVRDDQHVLINRLMAQQASRTHRLGHITWACSGCAERTCTPRSRAHLSCPRCQNHCTTEWLERQRQGDSRTG